MFYDYKEAIQDDIRSYLADNDWRFAGYSRDELEEKLNDELWIEDSVTGNGSGSYTFSTYDAQQYVEADGKGYFEEAASEYCISAEEVAEHLFDYEYIDVTIRCYLLGECISEVLDEMEEDGCFDEEEEEEVKEA